MARCRMVSEAVLLGMQPLGWRVEMPGGEDAFYFLLLCNSCARDFFVTFLPLFSSPFFKITLMGFNIPYSHMGRKYINHTHRPLPFPFVSLLH
jgi:hypothetical protein